MAPGRNTKTANRNGNHAMENAVITTMIQQKTINFFILIIYSLTSAMII